MLVLAFWSSAIVFGAACGGEYADLVNTYGTLPDIVARNVGFAIKTVTINGASELAEHEVLDMAGLSPRKSLMLLDVADVRKRLTAVPLIREASVTKLYPNRLVIDIEERKPAGLWQKDGVLSVVAADGMPVDDLRDARFERLPLVVGQGANTKIADYTAILEAAGELRDRIRAGLYLSERRWSLKTEAGTLIDLPEINPTDAIARFAKLEHDTHVLSKDIVAVDLRIPGRVVARLSADAAGARADALAKKTKKKGATT